MVTMSELLGQVEGGQQCEGQLCKVYGGLWMNWFAFYRVSKALDIKASKHRKYKIPFIPHCGFSSNLKDGEL